jgi:hypothetical protein
MAGGQGAPDRSEGMIERESTTPSRTWTILRSNVLFVLAVGILIGIVGAAAVREVMKGHVATSASSSPRSAVPPRPPLTRAEEAYIQALWPIHGDVERTAVRVSLGNIFYKINEIRPPELKRRLDDALATYRQAKIRLAALEPPPSFEGQHNDYLTAVGLFEGAALEVLKMFDDGNDNHLLVAYPLSREGANKIRAVGAQFWRDEFPPN